MVVSKFTRMIIMGPPGSGKGTISERILKDFNMKYLATGNMLRQEMSLKTKLGLEAGRFIDAGKLVPDDVISDVVLGKLASLRGNNWLLDGFPRTIAQAEAVLAKEEISSVLNLNIPFQIIIDRIKGRWTHVSSGRIYHTEFNPPKVAGKDDITGETLIQREDDKEETVRERLENYSKSTQPLLEFFRERDLLFQFTGKYSNEIWPHVHTYIAKYMTPHSFTKYN